MPSGGRKAVEEMLDCAIQTAVDNDCCIEINANGFMWSQANAIDKDDLFCYMLKRISDLGAKTTIGSDAHEPFLVGKSYQTLLPVLREFNITSTCIFSDGKQQIVPLG
jgi:histidinol phosphatase-like PHP family hydrolase